MWFLRELKIEPQKTGTRDFLSRSRKFGVGICSVTNDSLFGSRENTSFLFGKFLECLNTVSETIQRLPFFFFSFGEPFFIYSFKFYLLKFRSRMFVARIEPNNSNI